MVANRPSTSDGSRGAAARRPNAHPRAPRSGARQHPFWLSEMARLFKKIIPARYADLAGTTRSTTSSRPAASCAARLTTRLRRSRVLRTAGRVRLLPAGGAQLGGFRGDQEILRAVCPLRRAPLSPAERQPRRLARLDLRERRGFQHAAREGGRGDVRQARGEEARGGVGRGTGMDREARDCACARDRTGAIFEPLLNEHSMWFTSRRLYPDHTPGSF